MRLHPRRKAGIIFLVRTCSNSPTPKQEGGEKYGVTTCPLEVCDHTTDHYFPYLNWYVRPHKTTHQKINNEKGRIKRSFFFVTQSS